MPSLIPLFDLQPDPQSSAGPRILQLYQDLELYSEGDPPANALFVLGRSLAAAPGQEGLWRDQLLVIDPPADLETRFRLAGDVAVLYTQEESSRLAASKGPAQVHTMAGGVAHIRVGEHFLDIYSQRTGSLVHLPAIGVLLGGVYGSDVAPPSLAPGSDGQEELDTLRLLARILKERHFQLYVPHLGTTVQEKLIVMERLAADVAYLHGLRRVIPALVRRGESWEMLETVGESLLPSSLQSPTAKGVHAANLRTLYVQP